MKQIIFGLGVCSMTLLFSCQSGNSVDNSLKTFDRIVEHMDSLHEARVAKHSAAHDSAWNESIRKMDDEFGGKSKQMSEDFEKRRKQMNDEFERNKRDSKKKFEEDCKKMDADFERETRQM